MVDFVNIIAVDPSGERVILLVKNKGPGHLLGKVTFPGGKDDQGDSNPALAAVRELIEETGVNPGAAQLHLVHSKLAKHGPLKTFFVACDISQARTMETEVVFVADIDAVVAASGNPSSASDYAPDFLELLEPALPLIRQLRAAAAGPAPRHPRRC